MTSDIQLFREHILKIENITSARLRKHVATVTQLLNLSKGDLEQLATFMGHSKDVHKGFYRMSDNAFQVNILIC